MGNGGPEAHSKKIGPDDGSNSQSPKAAGLQTRVVVETLTQVIPGTEIVAMVATSDEDIPGFDLEWWTAPAQRTPSRTSASVSWNQLASQSAIVSFSCSISGVTWES